MDQSSVNLIFKSMYRTFWEFFLDISLSLAVRIRPCSYNNLYKHPYEICLQIIKAQPFFFFFIDHFKVDH